jgi:thioesterase domain-containing protein
MRRATFLGTLILVGATALAAHIKRGDLTTAVFGDAPTLKTFLSAAQVAAERLRHRGPQADYYTLTGYERGASVVVPPAQLARFSPTRSHTLGTMCRMSTA